jgi:hypothetical protein
MARRGVLKVGTALAAGAALPMLPARASTRTGNIETTHASADVVRFFERYFRDKSAHDVDATMSHFNRAPFTYIDAILGWPFTTWQQLHDLFAQYMPQWSAGTTSTASRILGDDTSAIVYFTNSPNLFGPSEMRSIGVVNLQHGKVSRWIDYWDGRHFGIANLQASKLPDDQFPADFRESTVGETAAPAMKRAVARLNQAFVSGDASGLFSLDATFTDLVGHVQAVGPRHIGTFLAASGGLLPYARAGAQVRHVVGSATGGGYEWTAPGAVPRGVNTLELDDRGLITRFESMWDGSRVDDDYLLRLASAALER